MKDIKVIRRCPGCGVILQSIDETLAGFVPTKHVERHEVVLCQRCFKLQHYGQDIGTKEVFKFDEFYKILAKAKQDKAVIIWVLDILNFETTLSTELLAPLNGLDVYFVASKRDLLPKNLNNQRLTRYISDFLKSKSFPFKGLLIASSKTNQAFDELQTIINTSISNKDIYIIGATSSGKSTLVNTYLKNFSNQTKKLITTSPFPGTTLRVIEIPLGESQVMYDTPGYIAEHSMLAKVEKEVVKMILPKVEMKPKHYQLGSKDSLAIGGLARLDIIEGKKQAISFYFSNLVEFHKTSIEKADSSFISLITKKHIQPTSKYALSLKSFETFELTLETTGRIDIAISGYGWISLPCLGQTIRVLVPKGILVKQLAVKV
jgi:ribosome biogenesis GTPase YqeH